MPLQGCRCQLLVNWFGVFAPAGTPEDVILILNRDFVKALQSDELKESVRSLSLDIGDDRGELAARVSKLP